MRTSITRRSALAGLLTALVAGAPLAARAQDKPAESPDGKPITTVDKYDYLPQEKLPPPKGTSGYEWDDKEKIVKFPINVWIGWAPIIAANHGFKANKDSVFYKKYGFQVDLPIIDDPIAARDAFASGKSHILWGTLDMMVLFAPDLAKDSRTALRIFQQIDWSNGGDGIVARNGIKSINDLKPVNGKKRVIVLAQQSPSHYYVLSLLYYAGIEPSDVEFKFTGNAFQAAAAFVNEKSIDACVTWSPDIYNLVDPKRGVKDAVLLSSTKDAKRVIADVWAARADFANDHPEVMDGLVRGIFDGMDMLKADPKSVARLIEDGFKLNPGDAEGMFGDAHQTNCAENVEFFLNRNNPTNFENTWNAIAQIYGRAGYLDMKGLPKFDQVMDPRLIDSVQPDYKNQKNEYVDTFAHVEVQTDPNKVDPNKKEILTRTVRIHFAPNISDIDNAYDPNADKIVEEAGRMANQFGAATIVIIGHCDRSMYQQASDLGPEVLERQTKAVKELSEQRAKGVVAAIMKKYPDFKADKFQAIGMGWDKPLANDALSRRVEIKVLAPE